MPHLLRRLVAALVGVLALTSGAALAPATAAVPGHGTITGVVRGPGGVPAAGVTVTAMEKGAGAFYVGEVATTDAVGRYALEVRPGGHDLRAQDPRGRFARSDVLGLTVGRGAVTTRDLRVVKGLTLTGRVSRADGGPVAGIAVTASTPDPRETHLERGATVAADGTYTLRGLHPATWRVLVDPFGVTDALLLPQDLGGRARADRNAGVGTAVAVTADRTLPTVRLRHRTPVVTGLVRGVGDRPVRGLTVHTDDENWWLDDDEDGEVYPGIGDGTDAAGRYTLRLATPGRTMPLYVGTGGTGYAERPFTAAVPAVGGSRTVDVRVRSTATLAPTVTSTRTRSTVRVVYRPAVAGATRVARVSVRYTATDGRARKVRGTLSASGVVTLRLAKVRKGTRSVKVHVAGNADAVAVTRTVRARIG